MEESAIFIIRCFRSNLIHCNHGFISDRTNESRNIWSIDSIRPNLYCFKSISDFDLVCFEIGYPSQGSEGRRHK